MLSLELEIDEGLWAGAVVENEIDHSIIDQPPTQPGKETDFQDVGPISLQPLKDEEGQYPGHKFGLSQGIGQGKQIGAKHRSYVLCGMTDGLCPKEYIRKDYEGEGDAARYS